MEKMSKAEMLLRVAASATGGNKMQILTDFGIIECELNNLVTQEHIDKNEPCTPMQITLSFEEDEETAKLFKGPNSLKHEFVLLKNAVIHYPSGGQCVIGELVLFLDSIEGFSVGHLEQKKSANN